jgi:DNA ligase (NAD+)
MEHMNDTSAASLADLDAYVQAVEQVRTAAAAYYADGSSPLDDESFDRLMRGIERYEAEHPEEHVSTSPTAQVAAGALGPGQIAFSTPMLSLDNVFDAAELDQWGTGLEKRIGHPPLGFHPRTWHIR